MVLRWLFLLDEGERIPTKLWWDSRPSTAGGWSRRVRGWCGWWLKGYNYFNGWMDVGTGRDGSVGMSRCVWAAGPFQLALYIGSLCVPRSGRKRAWQPLECSSYTVLRVSRSHAPRFQLRTLLVLSIVVLKLPVTELGVSKESFSQHQLGRAHACCFCRFTMRFHQIVTHLVSRYLKDSGGQEIDIYIRPTPLHQTFTIVSSTEAGARVTSSPISKVLPDVICPPVFFYLPNLRMVLFTATSTFTVSPDRWVCFHGHLVVKADLAYPRRRRTNATNTQSPTQRREMPQLSCRPLFPNRSATCKRRATRQCIT